MALLDLVPPAIDLVLDHSRLVDKEDTAREQIDERSGGAGGGRGGDTGEEFPTGKDAHPARGYGLLDEIGIVAGFNSRSAEAHVDRGKQALGDRCLGKRQQQGFVEGRGGALGFWIELADGLDLVAEELEAHGPVGFGRVDIEDAAAAGVLAGHLDDVHGRVADAGEVRDEGFDIDLFAAPKNLRQAGIERRGEELHGCGFDRGDDDGRSSSGHLPECGCARFLNFGVRREVFEGQHVVRGKFQDAVGRDRSSEVAARAKSYLQGVGGLVIGNDDDDGRVRGAGEERDIEGPGGGRESRDTTTPTGKGEVPSCLFKRG